MSNTRWSIVVPEATDRALRTYLARKGGKKSDISRYAWSSYRSHGLGNPAKFWTPHPAYSELGRTAEERAIAYRELFRGHIDSALIRQIRQASNQGMALGSERFKKDIERLAGRRVVSLKRGPRPKQGDGEGFLF